MTPKEKAQELDSHFYELVADTPDPEWRAKQAALIAVDEILSMGIMSNSGDWRMAKSYWEEVKQELENL